MGKSTLGVPLLTVQVRAGDITMVTSDALLTAVNSGRTWAGRIDGAIRRSAGNMFHGQLGAYSLEDGMAIYAPSTSLHEGLFRSVIFVIDDLRRPLHDIILAGLRCAEREGLAIVTIPVLRTGTMAGLYERTQEEAYDQLVDAIQSFKELRPIRVHRIQVVVFNNKHCEDHIRKGVSEL
jgi:O-acetyl-ADP-ribose deacetylase (regulator of RNase III)